MAGTVLLELAVIQRSASKEHIVCIVLRQGFPHLSVGQGRFDECVEKGRGWGRGQR